MTCPFNVKQPRNQCSNILSTLWVPSLCAICSRRRCIRYTKNKADRGQSHFLLKILSAKIPLFLLDSVGNIGWCYSIGFQIERYFHRVCVSIFFWGYQMLQNISIWTIERVIFANGHTNDRVMHIVQWLRL